MLKSDRSHWGTLAKFFHWTIVLLILTQAFVGLTMVNLPRSPAVIPWYTFHKSIGLTVLALALLRLSWRLFDPRPEEPSGMPRWQALGARAGHALLYLLIFLVPLSGWWLDSVTALRPLYWFGLIHVPPLGGPDPAIPDLKEIAKARHELLFLALACVALGHAAMALIHQIFYRDNVLGRMWPASLQPQPKPPTETLHVATQPVLAEHVVTPPAPTAPVVAAPPADEPRA